MPFTPEQRFRLLIQDKHQRGVEDPTGDGLTSAFQLSGYPIAPNADQSVIGSGTVISAYSGFTATFIWDYGVVVLNEPVPEGNSIGTAVYYHSVFSDEEVTEIYLTIRVT